MSAYVVTKKHIDYLVGAALKYGEIIDEGGPNGPQNYGAILWAENHRSVNHRYGDDTETPGYTYEPIPDADFTPGRVFKAIACLRYQSCETPDWTETKAHAMLFDLMLAIGHKLPGYEEAPWGIR